jgi:hypothetical protein
MNRRTPAERRRSPATLKDEDAPMIPVRAMAAIQLKQPMPIGRNRLERVIQAIPAMAGATSSPDFPGFRRTRIRDPNETSANPKRNYGWSTA